MRTFCFVTLLSFAFVGCTKIRLCKNGTALVTFSLPAAATSGETIDIAVTTPSGSKKSSLPLAAGLTSGTVEIDFAPYATGQAVTVALSTAGTMNPAAGSKSFSLPASCLSVDVPLTSTTLGPNNDLGGVDLSQTGTVPDLSGGGYDLTSVDMGPPVLAMTPANFVWPMVSRGSAATMKATFTILNNRPTAVAFVSKSLAGTNPGDFAIDNSSTCMASMGLATGQSCTIVVTFSPTLSGMRAGQLQTLFSDNTMLTASLSGNATPAWSKESFPSSIAIINAVWGSSSSDVYIVGEYFGSTVVGHSTGTGTWSAFGGPSNVNNLSSIWGTGPNQVFVGGNLGVWRTTGNMIWNQESTPSALAVVYGMSGTTSGDLYAVGDNTSSQGHIFHRSTNGTWADETPTSVNYPVFRTVVQAGASTVWTMGDSGILLITGLPSSTTSWSSVTSFASSELYCSWYAPNGDAFVGTTAGVWHLPAGTTTWKQEMFLTANDFVTGVSGRANPNGGIDVYAINSVSSSSAYYSKGDGTWMPVPLPTTSRNFGLWVSSDGQIYVAGDQLAHYY
jgi:hypothetical protein